VTNTDARIEELLRNLDSSEPGSYQLGTPELAETDDLRQLVALGAGAVPSLLSRLRDEQSSKRAAFIVLALNRIGYRPALEPIAEILARYENRPHKNAWDYALIGQCRLAIAHLRNAPADNSDAAR
jgi:hypothetical protein